MRDKDGRWNHDHSDTSLRRMTAEEMDLSAMERQFRETHLRNHEKMQDFVRTLSKTSMG